MWLEAALNPFTLHEPPLPRVHTWVTEPKAVQQPAGLCWRFWWWPEESLRKKSLCMSMMRCSLDFSWIPSLYFLPFFA